MQNFQIIFICTENIYNDYFNKMAGLADAIFNKIAFVWIEMYFCKYKIVHLWRSDIKMDSFSVWWDNVHIDSTP